MVFVEKRLVIKVKNSVTFMKFMTETDTDSDKIASKPVVIVKLIGLKTKTNKLDSRTLLTSRSRFILLMWTMEESLQIADCSLLGMYINGNLCTFVL